MTKTCLNLARLRQDFDPRDFKPDDYDIGLNPDFEARMSIFYADFDKNNNYNSILKPPELSMGDS